MYLCVFVRLTQGDKMDLGSDSSEDEDVEEFRYEMDIDEHRFLPLQFLLSFVVVIYRCYTTDRLIVGL